MSKLRNSTMFYENVCKSKSWDFKDLKLLYNLHLSYIYRPIYDLNSESFCDDYFDNLKLTS